jgi:hypothetical protein
VPFQPTTSEHRNCLFWWVQTLKIPLKKHCDINTIFTALLSNIASSAVLWPMRFLGESLSPSLVKTSLTLYNNNYLIPCFFATNCAFHLAYPGIEKIIRSRYPDNSSDPWQVFSSYLFALNVSFTLEQTLVLSEFKTDQEAMAPSYLMLFLIPMSLAVMIGNAINYFFIDNCFNHEKAGYQPAGYETFS